MNFSESDHVYLKTSEINRKIQLAASSNEILNIVHNHKFSLAHTHAIAIYLKLVKLIPTHLYKPRKLGKLEMRKTSDPRFSDRRMQALLRMLSAGLPTTTGPE